MRSVAVEHQLPYWLAPAMCLHGWATCREGGIADGTDEIRRGLELMRALGFRTWYGYYLSFLGESDLARGVAGDGLAAVREALALSRTLLDCFYEAELHRLHGMLLEVAGDRFGAAACFERALAVAHRQRARSYELRAATTCARSRATCGDVAGAHAVLARVCASMHDAFETRDAREAKALLDALSRRARAGEDRALRA